MTKTTLQAPRTGAARSPKTYAPVILTFVALAVALASAGAWLHYTQNDPGRVFWGAVENNLKTSSFTRTIIQDEQGQKTNQIIQTQTGPTHLMHSKTSISYEADSPITVETENIGTPTTDYVRYTNISTQQNGVNGKPLDFSSVLNTWGKTEATAPDDTSGQQYNESVLSVLPFGSLNAQQRADLLRTMKDSGTYKYDLVKTSRSGIFQRPTHTFSVEVSAEKYVGVLKQYAEAVGLTQLKDVDATQYASAEPVKIEITVDGWSRQLQQVVYGGGARVERISAYNSVRALPQVPSQAIPVDQLQEKLQKIQ